MRDSTLVDAHAHVALQWYEPIETLLFHMERNGVGRAVLTQLLGHTDNRYIAACRDAQPDRFATIVAVDEHAPDAIATLTALAAAGARGVRLRPGTRSPGDDPLLMWRAAERLGLVVSCPGTAESFASEDFAALVAALPRLPIVIEHLAAQSAPDADEPARMARRAAFGLARFPNVYCKVAGLGEFAPRATRGAADPFVRPIPPLLDEACAAFGPRRLMWGSDFPVVSSREGYANGLSGCRDALAHRSADDLAAIFGGTADTLFFSPT